jgi:hypothetical protein
VTSETLKLTLLPNSGEANSTIFILGSTGSGKTTLLANLVKSRERFVVIDSKEDYVPEFFGNLVKVSGDLNEFVTMLNEGDDQIIFQLYKHQNRDQVLSVLLSIIFDFQLANYKELASLTVALDEVDSYCTSRGAPYGLEMIVKQGRSVCIQKIFSGLWFADIPAWARDTFTEIYAFTHHDKNGLQRLEQFGFDSEQVKTLPAYVCAYVGKGETKQIRLITN